MTPQDIGYRQDIPWYIQTFCGKLPNEVLRAGALKQSQLNDIPDASTDEADQEEDELKQHRLSFSMYRVLLLQIFHRSDQLPQGEGIGDWQN